MRRLDDAHMIELYFMLMERLQALDWDCQTLDVTPEDGEPREGMPSHTFCLTPPDQQDKPIDERGLVFWDTLDGLQGFVSGLEWQQGERDV